jgi:alanyl aminopeptidase
VRILSACSLALALALVSACPGSRAAGPSTGGGDTSVDAAPEPLKDVPIAAPPTDRLGDDAAPTEYWLDVAIDPDAATYSGQVRIALELANPASSIWLHSRNLTIGKATLARGEETLELTQLESDPKGDLIGFAFGKTIAAGPAMMEITFAGRYGKADGTFVQTYEGRRYLYTDFEPIDARASMPCFDDPRFKTPWTISMVIPTAQRGYSNSPLASEEEVGDASKRLTFAKTRPLPTYLVAYAAGPFDEVDAGNDLVPMRMIVPSGKADWGAASAAMGPELLRVVTDYVGGDVPFDKVDLIAVPEFNGAMENPGLITVAARILLEDPAGESIEDQRLLALVHAHEYAHLWFGDLVTLEYWNEIWLNEGFATWMADKALAAWRPKRGTYNDEVVSKGDAMIVDSALTARAVRQPITSHKDIRDAFDAITYKKGGAIIAMLEGWLGEAAFRKSVRAYVKAHVDGVATTTDLATVIEKQTGTDVSGVLASFTDQNGIPLIDASISCTADASRVTLSQRRYLYAGNAQLASDEDTKRLWHVPVCLRYPTANGTARKCTLLTERSATVDLPTKSCPAWVYPNADADGYYRYDMPNDTLLELAANAPLTEREMVELAAHTSALVQSNDINAALALKIIEKLAPRAGRLATTEMLATVAFIADHMVVDAQQSKLASYVDRVFGKAARDLGLARVAGESDDDTLLRPELVALVGRYSGNKRMIRKVTKAARTWLSTGEGLPDELVVPALVIAASHGGATLFDDIVVAIEAVADADVDAYERREILATALGSFTDVTLVERGLEMASDPRIGPTHVVTLISALGDTAQKRQQLLDYLAANIGSLATTNRGRYVLLGPLFDVPFCSIEHAASMEAILDAVLGSEHELKAQLGAHLFGTASNCTVVRDANEDAVRDYLD